VLPLASGFPFSRKIEIPQFYRPAVKLGGKKFPEVDVTRY
jgi:hypothetical protein